MKHCTYPAYSCAHPGRFTCQQPATSAVKGAGRLYWYRCEKHKGMRANGGLGEVLYEGVGL